MRTLRGKIGARSDLVADTLLGELNYRDMGIGTVSPEQFIDLIRLIQQGR